MEKIIKISSYTERLPKKDCKVKVAVKKNDWNKMNCIKTEIFENALYIGGFVSVDRGKNFYLAGNFLFHKLKRKPD